MSNIIKIIVVVLVFIAIVFTAIFFLIPGVNNASSRAAALEEQKESFNNLIQEQQRLKEFVEEVNVLKARNEILSLKLPYEHDISILTNELYEIARISDIQINSIDHVEIRITDAEGEDESPINIFETDMVLQGSYYNILNYIYTLEIMPRISIIENIIIQSDNEDHEILSIFLTFRSYYLKDRT